MALIVLLVATSIFARYGFFGGILALALLPVLLLLAIPGFFVLVATLAALGG